MVVSIQDNVPWFKIPMHDLLTPEVLKSLHNFSCEVRRQRHGQALLLRQEVSQRAILAELQKQIEFIAVFERLVQLDDRGMVQVGQYASLNINFFNPSFGNESLQQHFLQAIILGPRELGHSSLLLLVAVELNSVDCSVGACAD